MVASNKNRIRETDGIVLGDFNDNPYAKRDDGTPRYTNFLYQSMAFKKYRDRSCLFCDKLAVWGPNQDQFRGLSVRCNE